MISLIVLSSRDPGSILAMLAGFEHFRDLPIEDKLRLVEEMWDDIFASNELVTLSPSVRDEVMRRAAESDRDPSSLLTEEEVWRRVDEARG
jgi:putative addiction module component (TIGR02574 family)